MVSHKSRENRAGFQRPMWRLLVEAVGNGEAAVDDDVGVPGGGASDASALETCSAEFDFNSGVDGDLQFSIGEVIVITRKDGEWWTGYVIEEGIASSEPGIFPANFVKAFTPHPSPVPPPSVPHPLVSQPQRGRIDTSSSVPMAASGTGGTNHSIGTRSQRTASKASSGHDGSVSPNPPSGSVGGGSAKHHNKLVGVSGGNVYVTVAPFKAAGPEQLTLEQGDIVQVRQKSETGWWEGEFVGNVSQSNTPGRRDRKWGWFPGNFVKPQT